MKSPRIMFAYAAFLVVCGLLAFAMAGFTAKAKTALIVAGVTAAPMIIAALLARMIHRRRTLGMIGIHVGLALPVLFTVGFVIQGWKSWQLYQSGQRELYLPIIIAVMAVGSVMAFIKLLRSRPGPEARG
jgi:hypothetical protein